MSTEKQTKQACLHFDFLTLFPETIQVWMTTSILGRALEKGIFSFETHQLRDYATGKYRAVDDAPYGGGGGMVLCLEPLVAAVDSIRARNASTDLKVVSFSPRGKRIDQALLGSLNQQKHFLFVCGHYEGMDQRFLDGWVDLEVSLGDFVVTGGELPSLALADALIRRSPGALASDSSHQEESFSLKGSDEKTLLEYPHFTRPADFQGLKVPSVLLNGDHARIREWRRAQSLEITRQNRPDLLD